MPRALRTLFLTQWFDPEPGAMRGLPLAKWLSAHGHDVEVLTGFPNYPGGTVYPGYAIRWRQREMMDGISVVRVPLYPSHDRRPIHRFANYGSFALSAATIGAVSVRAADVGFVYHPPPTVGFPAMVLKALRGTPFVYHIADMWPESVVESGLVGNSRVRAVVESLLHSWCNTVYRAAAAITVLSPGFKRLLVERGTPAEKVHVIYNWTDEAIFRPLPRNERLATELGLRPGFRIVYAGNLGIFQGLETVLHAAALMREEREISFVFVGTGNDEESLKAKASEMALDNVSFVGRRPTAEMPEVNALADGLLVHLRDLPFFAATVPSKTQVSMASGRPIVMAVRGDAADIIEKARAGVTCEPDNPMKMAAAIRLLRATPAAEREAMGARGREHYIRHMSLDEGGSRMDRLLRGVVESGVRSPARLQNS